MVVRVLTTVFAATLSMISSDFNSFPEIRMAFFSFLKSIIKYNFEQLYNMPEDKFHTIMDCIVWSIKHELNTFSDLGLELLYETLQNLTNNVGIANIFYERYYTSLLKDILEVLTDGYHKSGFKMQCKILFLMFQVVTSNYVTTEVRLGFLEDRWADPTRIEPGVSVQLPSECAVLGLHERLEERHDGQSQKYARHGRLEALQGKIAKQLRRKWETTL